MGWKASTDLAVQALWRSRVEAHSQSGQSHRTFSAQQNISADSLRRWRSWFEKNDNTPVQLPALVEVHIEDSSPEPRRDHMVLELGSGRRVWLEPDFDSSAVARLVTLLERL